MALRGLGIPVLAEIRGVQFKYSGGNGVAGNGVEGMAIPILGLGSYLSLFTSWAPGAPGAGAASSSWRSLSPALVSPASPRSGIDHGRWRRLGHGNPWSRPGDCLV